MRLRLKENPREWQKFTAAATLAAGIVVVTLWRRRVIGPQALFVLAGLLVTVLLLCLVRPRWFRSFYRGGMRAGFVVGQVVGQVLLAVVFVGALTPLALLSRCLGKDPLRVKPDLQAATFWQAAKTNEEFDREF